MPAQCMGLVMSLPPDTTRCSTAAARSGALPAHRDHVESSRYPWCVRFSTTLPVFGSNWTTWYVLPSGLQIAKQRVQEQVRKQVASGDRVPGACAVSGSSRLQQATPREDRQVQLRRMGGT